MIVGRHKEQSLLAQIFESEVAEFLVIFGRRRIGKTYLIDSFFSGQECIFFQVIGVKRGRLHEQLAEFANEIGRVFYGGAKIESPKTWMQAFEALNTAIAYQKSDKKIVLFFDEFPWLATKGSRLLQALEYYWNKYWKKNNNLKLIICGSSASWIIQKIIHHKGGLHNRITQQINLKPLNLAETKLFLEKKGIVLNAKQVLEIYCIMGGVPYYLEQVQKGLSIAQNVNQLCFQKEGLLFGEFDKLFTSLFTESEAYEELIRIIAQARHGMGREEVESKIKQTKKGGTLTHRLQDLEMAGFIKSFLPIGHTKKGLYYRIIDEYTLFYLQWIEPEMHNIELEIENSNLWLTQIKTPKYHAWLGYVFESVCYKHVAYIKKALNIHMSSKIGTWRYIPQKGELEQGAQIDLLFDRQDDAVTICEIKFSEEPFVIDKNYSDMLQRKIKVFKQITRSKKQIFLAMIVAHGLKKNSYSQELIAGIVTLEDFFNLAAKESGDRNE